MTDRERELKREGASRERLSWPGIVVYALSDPRDGHWRYVAIAYARTLPGRLRAHREGRMEATGAWALELAGAGVVPRALLLETIPCDGPRPGAVDWRRAGHTLGRHVTQARGAGHDLLVSMSARAQSFRRGSWR